MNSSVDLNEALAASLVLLQNPKSSNREAGAKKLRKLGLPEAGDALLYALQKELKDDRTWAVQYQIIIALGVTKAYNALPLLRKLVKQEFKATFLYQGLGYALLRLSYKEQGTELAIKSILATKDVRVFKGAFRAIAMLKLVPDDKTIQRIIKIASDPNVSEILAGYPGDKTGLRYWVAVACAGWRKELVVAFLDECEQIGDTALVWAVENARKGRYIKYDY